MSMNEFEKEIESLTQPINDQYPRPWMTKMKNPLEARVFIVGRNQRNGYPVNEISHRRHLDALFNKNGESCRGLYDEITQGKASPTRKNSDSLVAKLNNRNIHDILETDVICYSTPLSKDLRDSAHAGGRTRGTEIFRYLLSEISPEFLIVHGSGTLKDLSLILPMNRPQVPSSPSEIRQIQAGAHLVIPIQSFAPPAFNKWSFWADAGLDKVVELVCLRLS